MVIRKSKASTVQVETEESRIAKLETQVESIKEIVAELKADVKEIHSRITTGNREIMEKIDQKFAHFEKSENDNHLIVQTSVDKLSTRVNMLEQWVS